MKFADYIILFVALSINVALFVAQQPADDVDHVLIQVGHDDARTLSLDTDQTISVNGLLGEVRLQIQNRAIRFLDSPCNHKLCLRQGWIRAGGESGVCLPSGLSVHMVSREQRFDSTVF